LDAREITRELLGGFDPEGPARVFLRRVRNHGAKGVNDFRRYRGGKQRNGLHARRKPIDEARLGRVSPLIDRVHIGEPLTRAAPLDEPLDRDAERRGDALRGVVWEAPTALFAAERVDVLRGEARTTTELAPGDPARVHRFVEPRLPVVAHSAHLSSPLKLSDAIHIGFDVESYESYTTIDNFSFNSTLTGMNAEITPLPPSSSSTPSSTRSFAWLVDVGSCSDKGCVRADNEDMAFICEIGGRAFDVDAPALGALEAPLVLGVCDGMGGAAAGEVASRETATHLGTVLSSLGRGDLRATTMGSAISAALGDASRALLDLARKHPAYSGMGTTATVCALAGKDLVIGQVGDSRAYLLRSGELLQLTRDQTLAQLMVERGQLRPEEVSGFFGAHVILQAVGTTDRLEVDLRVVRVARGDVLLVCSDGLVEALSPEAITESLDSSARASAIAEELVSLANDAGATDNVTCVVARIVAGGPRGERAGEVVSPAEPLALEAPRLDQPRERESRSGRSPERSAEPRHEETAVDQPAEEPPHDEDAPPTRKSTASRIWHRLTTFRR
jgi:serine/threonine protein phosphatase PrpC